MFVCFRHKLFSDIYNEKYFIVFLHLSSSRSLQNDTDHGLRKKREVRCKAVLGCMCSGNILSALKCVPCCVLTGQESMLAFCD